MNSNQPKFFIIGNKEQTDKILNRLPNKNKLYDNYLYDIKEPFVEYGFFLQKEDINIGEFIVVVCPENINDYDKEIFKNDYFKNITALIICDNYNYNNIFDAKEVIYIMFYEQFDEQNYDINNNDLIYNFNDNNWINRIYNHLDIPFTLDNNDDVFNFSNLLDSCYII